MQAQVEIHAGAMALQFDRREDQDGPFPVGQRRDPPLQIHAVQTFENGLHRSVGLFGPAEGLRRMVRSRAAYSEVPTRARSAPSSSRAALFRTLTCPWSVITTTPPVSAPSTASSRLSGPGVPA